jgi:hypothetical protein
MRSISGGDYPEVAVHYQLNEEACPVSETLFGELYRANPHGLTTLIETVPAQVRALLADYCYRRAHLASLGLAIAASCEREDLIAAGSNGAALYHRSRTPDEPAPLSPHERRRKITLPGSATMKLSA